MKLCAHSRLISESIGTQTDGFGSRLESIIALIVEEVKSHETGQVYFGESHPALKQLEPIIFNRLKIKVDFITDEQLAAIMPFYSNRNHVFLPEVLRGYFSPRDQVKLLKEFDNKKGVVNVAAATVGGIYSEYEHPLYMNFSDLVKKCGMNATEITGILLHELGHAFNACVFSDRTDTTNQVLARILRHLNNSETGDIEYVYKELRQVTDKITKEEVDKMLHGPRVVAGATWFKIITGVVKSQTMDATYNQSSFEQNSDAFASRFGYGKALILALDKLHKFGPEKSGGYLIMSHILDITAMATLAILIFGALATGAVALGLVMIFYEYVFMMLHREDYLDHTYDTLKKRYLRIRQDMVDQLKNTRLKKEKIQGLLQMVYAADDAIAATREVKTLPMAISNFVFGGARNTVKSIDDQQLMEAIASNDLFVHAAELNLTA